MAGCVPCFIIPLLLFIFHRYIQPIMLRYWNPWENKQLKAESHIKENKTVPVTARCDGDASLDKKDL